MRGALLTAGSPILAVVAIAVAGFGSDGASRRPEKSSAVRHWILALGLVLGTAGGWGLAQPGTAPASAVGRVDPGPGLRPVLWIELEGVTAAKAAEAASLAFGPGRAIGITGEAGTYAGFWTTLATGQPPSVHRVRGRAARRLGDRVGVEESSGLSLPLEALWPFLPAPVDGRPPEAVGVPAAWQVLSNVGVAVGVVGAVGTWPVPRLHRFAVSDAALRSLTADPSPVGVAWPDRLAGWPSLPAPATDPDAFVVAAASSAIGRLPPPPAFLLLHVPRVRAGGRLPALLGEIASLAATMSEPPVVCLITPVRLAHPLASCAGRSGDSPARVRAIDLAPSLLRHFGVPRSRELPGRAVPGLLGAKRPDPGEVASYGRSRPEFPRSETGRSPWAGHPYFH